MAMQESSSRRHNFSMEDDLSPEDITGDAISRMPVSSNHSMRLQSSSEQSSSGTLRLVVLILLVVAVIFVVVDSLGGHHHIESAILDFLGWVEEHPHQGVLAVICVYIIATILFVPGSILTFGTGYAFGSAYNNKMEGVMVATMVSEIAVISFAPFHLLSISERKVSSTTRMHFPNRLQAVFIGASLGSICTFLLGRYLCRSCVVRLASSYPIFQAIDRGKFGKKNIHSRSLPLV